MAANNAEIFSNIGRVLTSSLNPREVFHKVMQLIGDYFSPRDWSLLLREEHTGRLRFEIFMGANAEDMQEITLEKGEGIVGWVCEHGQPAMVEDVSQDPRFSPRLDKTLGFTTHSVVCAPLLNNRNKVIGAIELINRGLSPGGQALDDTPDPRFTENDMQILSAIGIFTGIAAQNAFLHQKARELSLVDPLTKIHNRHYFNEMLLRESEKIKRYNEQVCLLMIDVDKFKTINDTHGHLVGDEVLRSVAGILKASVRDSDTLARFGGDEFVILMPIADKQAGHRLTARIHSQVRGWNLAQVLPGVTLSLSIGVHAAKADGVTDLLRMADQDMYHHKNFQQDVKTLVSEEEICGYLGRNAL